MKEREGERKSGHILNNNEIERGREREMEESVRAKGKVSSVTRCRNKNWPKK